LRFSPDGSKLLVGYGEAEMWDVAARRKLFTVPGAWCDFSPDGERFATAEGDVELFTEIKIWESSSGRELLHLQGGHGHDIMSVAYSPDGRYIVSADAEGFVRTWDAATGDLLDHGPIMDSAPAPVVITPKGPKWDIVTNSIGMQLARIEPGEFTMGSPASEPQRQDNEAQHRVKITKPFYMGRFEVMQKEYELVTGKTPSHFSYAGERKEVIGLDTGHMPVERVTWSDAAEFCRLLSEAPTEVEAGRSYRLPTEAEWEYACRAGTTTMFNVGDSLSPELANFDATKPYGDAKPGVILGRPRTVGSYPPNAWGFYDMHGNVWEWCADGERTYRSGATEIDPIGPTTGERRSLRGSGWFLGAIEGRSARRQTEPITWSAPNLGFRVVCEIKE
jgi:formylglycine-generating enzyme required for sulfatase activity